ncbi:MAG TPA: DUF4347 domain-containing protein [Bacteroidales bacterium]|nr:DUF4347 domain-containing protein [Bacteroidales bacterium]
MSKILLLFLVLAGITPCLNAQEGKNDLVIVGDVSTDLSMQQVDMRYKNNPNAYYIRETGSNAIDQISDALAGKMYDSMHIFVRNTASSLVFNNLELTADNIAAYTNVLAKWEKSLHGKIVIHTSDRMDDTAANNIAAALTKATGLEVIITI